MASSTQGDQIFLGIIPALAAKNFVVNIQIESGAATLASPSVTP
jgi:hypothetical protein